MVASHLGAQSVAPRISSEITNSEQATLNGSLHPMAQAQFDAGRMPAATKLQGISIVFSRSEAQEADLQALIAKQQDPASPLFHQWLNPDQFAARFGMADDDINKVESWLQQQGFSIDSVARSRNMIRFSGTVRQVELAFSTEMHYYNVGGEQHFAPSTELSVPAALESVVLDVRNLNDFRPRPMHVRSTRPAYTVCCNGSGVQGVFFAPGDIKTAYNIPSADTGAGQTIAIMGQSAIVTSDIENFQNAALLTVKDPTLVLVPGTGTSVTSTGDESESDIDLEWSGAVAPGATIDFVYVGNNTNFDVNDSIQYAVDEKIGNIISVSYGACETQLTQANVTSMELVTSQAATQGQTIIVSSGDSGSTACYGNYGNTNYTAPTAQDEAVVVNYPASSAYVTALGGTEITTANDVVGTYWLSAPSPTTFSTSLNTATKHIPEVAWNDDSATFGAQDGWQFALSSGGGGVSSFVNRPTWQAGVPGIPSGAKRLVPDISLYSSPNLPGYLYCTSDQSTWDTADGQEGSCGSGQFYYENPASQLVFFSLAGGTSFAAPTFAGMVAIINQQKGYTDGQGLINPTLYGMAATPATYASAFYDITQGGGAGATGVGNECTAGSNYCTSPGTTDYPTTTGYDEATGLGSINLTNLLADWTLPAGTTIATPIGTTISISATSSAPAVNAMDTFTFTVAAASGTTAPSGNLTLQIDGGGNVSGIGTGTTMTVALTGSGNAATATYQTSFATAGTHQIIAQYAGSSTLAFSTGVVQVNVAGSSSGSGTITLAASPATLTVSQGSSGTETLTITPAGGYTGTVLLYFDTSNDNALQNLLFCFTNTTASGEGSVAVTGTTAVTTQLAFDTNANDSTCPLVAPRTVGNPPFHRLGGAKAAHNGGANPAPLGLAFAGLLLAGFLGRYSRKFHGMAVMIALLAVGLAVSACGGGGGGGSNSIPDPPKGTYTITVTAADSVTSTITNQTTFTFTID